MQISREELRRGGRRGPQARPEDHGSPLLGDLRRSCRPRHRQSRARVHGRDRLRRRQAARRLPGQGARPADAWPRSTRTASRSRPSSRSSSISRVAMTSTLTVFETFTPGRPRAAGRRRAAAAAQGTVSRSATRAPRGIRNRPTRRSFRKRWPSSSRSSQAGGTARRRYRSHRRRRRRARLLQSAAARAARRGRVHAARGDPASGRRTVRSTSAATRAIGIDRRRQAGGPHRGQRRSRRRTSLTCATSRSSSSRASGFDPAKLIDSVRGKAGLVVTPRVPAFGLSMSRMLLHLPDCRPT